MEGDNYCYRDALAVISKSLEKSYALPAALVASENDGMGLPSQRLDGMMLLHPTVREGAAAFTGRLFLHARLDVTTVPLRT